MKHQLQYPLGKVGLPLIVTSSQPNLCFLIDTGATHNVIFSFVLESIKDSASFVDSSNTIMGIEGNSTEVPQIEMSLDFQDIQSKSIFSILDANNVISKIQKESGIQIHGILGIPFLIENEWIIDFKQLTITK